MLNFRTLEESDVDDYEHVDHLEKLKSLREKVDWKIEEKRRKFMCRLARLIKNWKGQIPNIRDIFRAEEIYGIVVESINIRYNRDSYFDGKSISNFVARSGYKDESVVAENGEPILRRTTLVHHAARSILRLKDSEVHDLFEIYSKVLHVNYTDEFGLTHFHMACEHGCLDIVERFLELGQDPNHLVPETGDSPLFLAVQRDHKEVAELLLRNGADPNSANAKGLTPLHVSCWTCPDDSLARMLIEFRSERYPPVRVDARNKASHHTPLHYALVRGWKQVIRVLLSNGADPNLPDKNGFTPVQIMFYKTDGDDLAKLFFKIIEDNQLTALVNVRNKRVGRAPLHEALRSYQKIETIKTLLRHGADPNLAESKGRTPLQLICRRARDDDDLLQLFLEHSLRVDGCDHWGTPPLFYTVPRGHQKMTALLLRNGADLLLANKNGETLLHKLCQRDTDDTDKMDRFFELAYGVRIDARDKWGQTPLQIAVSNLLPYTVNYLLNNGADLSNFVFPKANHFFMGYKRKAPKSSPRKNKSLTNVELKLATRAMIVVENLEKKGFEMNLGHALEIMSLCFYYGWLDKPADLDERWYDDEEFASEAKEIRIRSKLSLHDLIQLRPKEAARRLEHRHYFKLARPKKLDRIPEKFRRACVARLAEILLRRFFLRWALIAYRELTRFRLPIECCDMILEQLPNRDLLSTCFAAIDKRSQERYEYLRCFVSSGV